MPILIGQPVQYHSTKGAVQPEPQLDADGNPIPAPVAFVTHPGIVQAVTEAGATLRVFGPFGDYTVPDAAECPADAPEALKFNPLPA